MDRERLPVVHSTMDTHPHEGDTFVFMNEDNKVVSPVLETHRYYEVQYNDGPVEYDRGDQTVYVLNVKGTYTGMSYFENAIVTFCDAKGIVTEKVIRRDFMFVYREGDEIREIELPAPTAEAYE